MEEQVCINPIESQREAALKHYEEASSAIHHWSSFVENAIKAYSPTPAASTPAPAKEQFKMPTDERLIDIAVLFNDGKLEPEKLSDMVGMCRFVLDRLYENNDIMIPSSKENN